MEETGAGLTRREAIQTAAFAAGMAAAISTIPRAHAATCQDDIHFDQHDVVLFQGDSITDAGRDRGAQDHPNHTRALGLGYAMLAAAELRRDHAAANLRVFNRGISGNKVPDLAARWDQDCLNMAPRVLSILIGVNDLWHKLGGGYNGTVQDYRQGFSDLLDRTRSALPDVTIICCEPFVLRCGAVNDTWFPEFDDRRAVAKEVATAAEARWVPFQTMFNAVVETGTAPNYWAADGVHPTLAGHSLMVKTWRHVAGL